MIDYFDIEIDYFDIEKAAEVDDCPPDIIHDYTIMPPGWRRENGVD